MRRRGEAQNASALRALDSRAVEDRQWLERANKAPRALNLHAPFHSIAGDTPRDRCEPGSTPTRWRLISLYYNFILFFYLTAAETTATYRQLLPTWNSWDASEWLLWDLF